MKPYKILSSCLPIAAIALVLAGSLQGCSKPASEEIQKPSGQVKMEQERSLLTLTGTVIEKPWSQTVESWTAGGSNYYVLDVGDAQIAERSAAEGVILRPSEAVPFESFRDYIKKRVEVEGEYVAAQPYTPQGPWEQYPMGPDRKPLPRGQGFKVYKIKLLSGQ